MSTSPRVNPSILPTDPKVAAQQLKQREFAVTILNRSELQNGMKAFREIDTDGDGLVRLDDYLAYLAIKKSGTASYRSFKKASAIRDAAMARVNKVKLSGRRGSSLGTSEDSDRSSSRHLTPDAARRRPNASPRVHGNETPTSPGTPSTPRATPPADLQNMDIFATGKTEEEKAAMWAMIDMYAAEHGASDSDSIQTESLSDSDDSGTSRRSKKGSSKSRRRRDSSSSDGYISIDLSDSDEGAAAAIKNTTGRAAVAVGGAAKLAGSATSKAASATANKTREAAAATKEAAAATATKTKEAASALASKSKDAVGNLKSKVTNFRSSPEKQAEKEKAKAEAKAWEERMIARAKEREAKERAAKGH